MTVVTRGLADGHVIYALCIVPGRGYDSMARTFTQMLRTLNVNDDAFHRGTQTSSRSDSPRAGLEPSFGGPRATFFEERNRAMDTNLLLIIVVMVLLFGGGGFYWRRRR